MYTQYEVGAFLPEHFFRLGVAGHRKAFAEGVECLCGDVDGTDDLRTFRFCFQGLGMKTRDVSVPTTATRSGKVGPDPWWG